MNQDLTERCIGFNFRPRPRVYQFSGTGLRRLNMTISCVIFVSFHSPLSADSFPHFRAQTCLILDSQNSFAERRTMRQLRFPHAVPAGGECAAVAGGAVGYHDSKPTTPWFVVGWSETPFLSMSCANGGPRASSVLSSTESRTDLRDSHAQLLDTTVASCDSRHHAVCRGDISHSTLSAASPSAARRSCAACSVQPELRRVAEVPRKPQRRVRGYATLAINDVVHAHRRDMNGQDSA